MSCEREMKEAENIQRLRNWLIRSRSIQQDVRQRVHHRVDWKQTKSVWSGRGDRDASQRGGSHIMFQCSCRRSHTLRADVRRSSSVQPHGRVRLRSLGARNVRVHPQFCFVFHPCKPEIVNCRFDTVLPFLTGAAAQTISMLQRSHTK